MLGSWLGMLPGTCAYVAAGAYGADALAGSGTLCAAVFFINKTIIIIIIIDRPNGAWLQPFFPFLTLFSFLTIFSFFDHFFPLLLLYTYHQTCTPPQTPCTDGAFGGIPGWQVLLAIGATVGAVTYIGLLAKQALADIEQPHDSP